MSAFLFSFFVIWNLVYQQANFLNNLTPKFLISAGLLLCAVFGMGTAGAAIATVFAQIVSVIVSFILISKKDLPFTDE